MKTALYESKVERNAEAGSGCAVTCFELDAKEVAKRLEKGVSDAKAVVSEKLEDGKIAAERLLKQGQYALEDSARETTRTIKRHPFGSLAVAFAAGAALGLLVPRATNKK